MTFRAQHALRVLAVTSVVSIFTLLPGAVHAEDKAAWQLLWSNKFGAAQSAFRADLAKNRNDPSALRGLGWTSYYQDNKRAALNYWSRSVELAPSDWQSAGLWPIILDSAGSLRKFEGVNAAAKVLLSSPDVSASLKMSAGLVLANQIDMTQGIAKGNEYRKSLGLIADWRVVGPFDNVSKSGWNKPFAPENAIAFRTDLKGKDDSILKWRRFPQVGRDGMVTLNDFLGDGEPDVFYAATSVSAPEAMDVHAFLDVTGASKLFVNGAEAFSDSVYRNPVGYLPGAFDAVIHLNKGWNTLLVKVADDRSIGGRFRLRLTDAAGTSIKSVTVDSARCDGFAQSKAGNEAPTDNGAQSCIGAILAKHTDDVEGALLLGHYLQMVSDYQASENVLNGALKNNPRSASLFWELSQTLDDDGQIDDARSARDSARQLSHDMVEAELSKQTDDKESLTKAERVQQLKALSHRFPASDDVLFELAEALQAAGMNDNAFVVAKQAALLNGGSSGLLLLDGSDSSMEFENQQTQITAMVKRSALADSMDDSMWNSYAADLDGVKDTTDAIAAYKHLILLSPGGPRYTRLLAQEYRAAGTVKSALPVYALYAQQCPQDADAQSDYGQALEDTGHTSAAIAQYRLAVQLDPAQVDQRDKLQLLTGQKPVADLVPALPTPDLDKLRGKPTGPAPSIVMLVDEGREVVYSDFATQTRYHQVIKVNDQAAVNEFQTFELERNSGESQDTLESARLIKADGKIEDHTNDDNSGSDDSDGQSVQFPSLAPGDIIDVSYRVEDHSRGVLSHQFWTHWFFEESETQSVVSRFVLITPASMVYTFVGHNSAPDPVERKIGDWQIREWDVKNGPVVASEEHSPPESDWEPWIDVSTVASWKQIVDWYLDLSTPRCEPSPVVRNKAAELTKNCTTDEQKVSALVEFVSHDIQYQSSPFRLSAYVPTEGKEVIRERYGDCKDKAALLVALLDSIGIKAHMALLSPHEFGSTPYLPSPRFAHAIAVVDEPSGPVWVDGTADGLGYGRLPLADQGAKALEITPSAQDLTVVPQVAGGDDMHVKYDIKLTGDGKATIQTVFTPLGNMAWIVRNSLLKMPSDKKDEFLRFFAQKMTGAQYDSGSVSDYTDPETPIVITVLAHDDQFATPAGDFLLFGLPWTNSYGESNPLLGTPNRTVPIDLMVDRGLNTTDVTLELPNGYSLQGGVPKSAENAWGRYAFTYTSAGNVVSCHAEEENKSSIVPTSDVPTYLSFLKDEDTAADAKLVIKKS